MATNLDAWLARIEQLHPRSWDLGLERVGEVGRRLDVLKPAPLTYLVAGTNGKGSTCEAISFLHSRLGDSVGKSTSPHLVRFNERIVVDGLPATDEEICDAFEAIEAARGDISLSYFEFGALSSLLVFRERRVDVAVLEIGLGGRLDAMNIVDPDVSVITTIALDHEAWLGNDRETIAREKAGVMRAGKPCVIADPDPPATLLEEAARVGATVLRADAGDDLPAIEPVLPLTSLRAAIAALAAAGRAPLPAHVEALFGELSLPGRFQRLEYPAPTILDVAHNPAAAAWLAERLAAEDRREIHAVFGMYADKDIASVVRVLAPRVQAWYLCAVDEPRAADVERLAAEVSACGGSVAGKYAKVAEAYDQARANVGPDDVVLVFGSFPVVGEVLQHLETADQLTRGYQT